jgi:hypothetical protein
LVTTANQKNHPATPHGEGMTGWRTDPGRHAHRVRESAGVSRVSPASPGPRHGAPMRDEDEAAILAWAQEVAEAAPPLTEDHLARLRLLVNPPRTPTPSRGQSGGGPRHLGRG